MSLAQLSDSFTRQQLRGGRTSSAILHVEVEIFWFSLSRVGYATDRNRVSIPFLSLSLSLYVPLRFSPAALLSLSLSFPDSGSSLFTLVASLPARKPKPRLRSSSATTTTTSSSKQHQPQQQQYLTGTGNPTPLTTRPSTPRYNPAHSIRRDDRRHKNNNKSIRGNDGGGEEGSARGVGRLLRPPARCEGEGTRVRGRERERKRERQRERERERVKPPRG